MPGLSCRWGSGGGPGSNLSACVGFWVGDVGFDRTYADDTPLALCTDIDGLFVDVPARPREPTPNGPGRPVNDEVDANEPVRDAAAFCPVEAITVADARTGEPLEP